MNAGAGILRANALRLPLADESVDLIITSPPYFALRSYRDECATCSGVGTVSADTLRPDSHRMKVCPNCGYTANRKRCNKCDTSMQWPKRKAATGDPCPECGGTGQGHYEHQLGSEETPQAFLEALWAVTAECWRVLKPSGSMWVNLGDKYAGSNGQSGGGGKSTLAGAANARPRDAQQMPLRGGYVPTTDIRAKSLLGLPWRYAIGCIDGQAAPDGQRWILRAEVIWSKPNGLPESVTDRVRRSHEQWFHFVKSPRYFSAVDEVREAHTYPNDDRSQRNNVDRHEMRNEVNGAKVWGPPNPLGKLPGSVWSVPSEPLLIPTAVQRHYNLPDHFAAFPQEWPRRIILGWSPSGICVECGEGRRPVVAKELEHVNQTTMANAREHDGQARGMTNVKNVARESATITGYTCGCPAEYDGILSDSGREPRVLEGPGNSRHRSVSSTATAGSTSGPSTRPAVVLDPFGGTGTVAMVARTLGRFGVSVDLSADYCRLAKWRIWSSGHGEKAAQQTWRENQGDLFGNAPSVHIEDVEVGEAL